MISRAGARGCLLAAIPSILLVASPLFSEPDAGEPDAPENPEVQAVAEPAAPETGTRLRPITAEARNAPTTGGKAPTPNGSYFFGGSAAQGESEQMYESAFASRSDSSGITEEGGPGGRWSDQNINPIFPELEIFDEVSNKNSLKRIEQAQDHFERARRQILSGNAKAAEMAEEMGYDETSRYDWQRRERQDNFKRQIERVKSQHRREAIGNLIKAMQALDQVKNPAQLESKHFLDLKSEVFRMFVREQFKEKNLGPCIPVLERYMTLQPGNAVEPEPHRLLAASYRHREIMAQKMKNHKAYLESKKLKNQHLVKYAELAFGRTSPQYSEIAEQAQRDMIEVVP